MKRRRGKLPRCSKTRLVIIRSELDAKMILAARQRNDKGEKRYFACGNHYHLTAQAYNGEKE